MDQETTDTIDAVGTHAATDDTLATDDTVDTADTADTGDTGAAEVVEELLIEEISIDGMCGVY